MAGSSPAVMSMKFVLSTLQITLLAGVILTFGCIEDTDSFEASAPDPDVGTPDVGTPDAGTPDVEDSDVLDTGEPDAEETGPDTSEGCQPCEAGESCESNTDCISQICEDEVCQAPSCDDGVQNGEETDVDCGGDCPPCSVGDSCNLASDCTTELCLNGECLPPAASCQQLAAYGVDLPSGEYLVKPEGHDGEPYEVHCDFDADGGVGYLMKKIDDSDLTDDQNAYRAACEELGLELIVPRTRAHAQSIMDFNDGTPPNLVGVYPQYAGAGGLHNWEGRCQGEPCTFYMDDSDSAGCEGFEPNGNNDLDSALFRHGDGCFFGTWDDDHNQVDIEGEVICSTNDAGPERQQSCLDYRLSDSVHNAGPEGINGVYPLVDAQGETYEAYCDMETMGGGWTLSLKVDGRVTTFDYYSDLWTNGALHNAEFPQLDRVEAKLQSFMDLSYSQLLVGLEAPIGTTDIPEMRWLPMATSGSSLHEVFAADEFVATNEKRASWMGLVEGGMVQCNCNLEGLNVKPREGTNHSKVRIGFLGNNQQDCESPDSRLGLGGAGTACGQAHYTAGNTVACNHEGNYDSDFLSGDLQGCNPNAGGQNIAGFGALLVRDIPPRETCQDHLDAGITRSGIYPIDPGDDEPFNVYCEMEQAGGGWTLVTVNGLDSRPPRWSDNDYPRPGASRYGDQSRLEDDIQNIRSGLYDSVHYSIDAESLYTGSDREFLAYVGGEVMDFITGELPEECNFFDGTDICEHNTYTGLTITDSEDETVSSDAQACTNGPDVIEDDDFAIFDEFGLHIIDGHSDEEHHCFQSTDSELSEESYGRIYSTFEGSAGDFWQTGVHSHWREDDVIPGGQPGYLMLR